MLVARGIVEGSYDPASLYRTDYHEAPPQLEELLLVVPGADVTAVQAAAERGATIGEGARIARDLANRASNDVSPEVLADAATDLARAQRTLGRGDRAGPGNRVGHGDVHGGRAGQ